MNKTDEMNELKTIPYAAAEILGDRLDKVIKRLWILCILLIILLIGTNAMWIWYESQFTTIEVEQDIEADTGNGDFTNIGVGDNYGKGTH